MIAKYGKIVIEENEITITGFTFEPPHKYVKDSPEKEALEWAMEQINREYAKLYRDRKVDDEIPHS